MTQVLAHNGVDDGHLNEKASGYSTTISDVPVKQTSTSRSANMGLPIGIAVVLVIIVAVATWQIIRFRKQKAALKSSLPSDPSNPTLPAAPAS